MPAIRTGLASLPEMTKKAGGAGGRSALLTGRGVSPPPLFSSVAEGGKTCNTGKLVIPGNAGNTGKLASPGNTEKILARCKRSMLYFS